MSGLSQLHLSSCLLYVCSGGTGGRKVNMDDEIGDRGGGMKTNQVSKVGMTWTATCYVNRLNDPISTVKNLPWLLSAAFPVRPTVVFCLPLVLVLDVIYAILLDSAHTTPLLHYHPQ